MNQEEREAIIERYRKVNVATVADILDRKGFRSQALSTDIEARIPGMKAVAGWAYTIRGQAHTYEGEADPDKMKALEGLFPGSVAVWAGGDVRGCCLFGDLLTHGMMARGALGAVVDGGVRDVEDIAEMGFPVYARYKTPLQSAGRWKVTGWNEPILIPGAFEGPVRVSPGDFIAGNLDGVVVVPEAVVLEVLDEAEHLLEMEEKTRAQLDSGDSLDDVVKKYGRI